MKKAAQALGELKGMTPFILIADGIILALIAVFAFTFGFDWRLLSGLVAGNLVMTANFIGIGITTEMIAKAKTFKRGQFLGNLSYGIRYVGMFVILALLLTFDLISPFTALIPLFFPKLYYTVRAFRGKLNDN